VLRPRKVPLHGRARWRDVGASIIALHVDAGDVFAHPIGLRHQADSDDASTVNDRVVGGIQRTSTKGAVVYNFDWRGYRQGIDRDLSAVNAFSRAQCCEMPEVALRCVRNDAREAEKFQQLYGWLLLSIIL
jgi:hypothetical protein